MTILVGYYIIPRIQKIIDNWANICSKQTSPQARHTRLFSRTWRACAYLSLANKRLCSVDFTNISILLLLLSMWIQIFVYQLGLDLIYYDNSIQSIEQSRLQIFSNIQLT